MNPFTAEQREEDVRRIGYWKNMAVGLAKAHEYFSSWRGYKVRSLYPPHSGDLTGPLTIWSIAEGGKLVKEVRG